MLLGSTEFSQRLVKSLSFSKTSVLLSSAFVKINAIESITGPDFPSVNVSVVARWKKQDLLVGASDIEVYKYCRDKGWRFGIDQNFHGKLYLIDDTEIYLGSANLTGNGFGFNAVSNFEFGTVFSANEADMKKVNTFLDEEVTWLDDGIYDAIYADIEASKISPEPFANTPWSDDVMALINTPVNHLWVNDLPFVTPSSLLRMDFNCEFVRHDFELLGLDLDRLSKREIIFQFKRSRVYSWLLSQLSGGVEMNFGKLTKALHNALLDDPTPYRRDVKDFLINIFEWVKFMPDDFVATKHNKTTSIKRTDPQ